MTNPPYSWRDIIQNVYSNVAKAIRVISYGTTDNRNSSEIALDPDETFTGESIDVSDIAELRISIATDVISAIDGLSIQFSKDETNWDWCDEYSVKGPNFREEISVSPSAQYFRIVYTNGSTIQSFFRLSTLLKGVRGKPSSHRVKDVPSEEDDVELNKSVIAYQKTNDGTINNVSIQNPFPVDGDSVYAKDVWEEYSIMNNFSGSITDLFDNLHSLIIDSTSNATKELFIHFNRTIISNTIGLGSFSGNFSNTKIEIYNSGNIATTVVDESTDNTKYTSRTYQIPVTAGFNAIKFTFSTTDTVTLSNIVQLKTRSVVARIQCVRDDGTVGDTTLSNSNRLRTVSQPYTYAIAEGDIPEHNGLLKFGTRTTVLAGQDSTAWEGPTNKYVYLTSAERLYISSTSVNDTSAGTGARTLIIYGLDVDYNEINETITLASTTPVLTDASFIRVFRALVLTCGTSYTNEGTISILNNAQTTTQALINIGDGQTLMTMWTVPANKTAYLVKSSVSTSSNKGAQISLFVRKINGGTLFPWLIKYRGFIFSGAIQIPQEIPYVIPEKTDIEMRVLTPTNAGTTSLGGTFELWYE